MSEQFLPIGQAAEFIGVSIDTLRRWEAKGKIASKRLDGKNRFFKQTDLENLKFGDTVTVKEAAHRLGMSPATLRRISDEGAIPSQVAANGYRQFRVADLEGFITKDTKAARHAIAVDVVHKTPSVEQIPEPSTRVRLVDIQGKLSEFARVWRFMSFGAMSLVVISLTVFSFLVFAFLAYPKETAAFFGFEYRPLTKQSVLGSQASVATENKAIGFVSAILQQPAEVALKVARVINPVVAQEVVLPEEKEAAIISQDGKPGATGAQGPAGANGLSGIQGQQGKTGATGSTGTSGPTGIPGSNGATGSSGPTGVPGSTGADGSFSGSYNSSSGLVINAYGTGVGETTALLFYELAANGSNYVGLKSPDSIATSTTWTLPAADGTTGQCIATNGSATLSFADCATTAITNLNGLTGQTQTFATGTSGTNFNISSSGTTHTFNIPDAGSSARGLVTTGTQTFAGSKTFTGNTSLQGLMTFGNDSADDITINSAGLAFNSDTAFYLPSSQTALSFGVGAVKLLELNTLDKKVAISGTYSSSNDARQLTIQSSTDNDKQLTLGFNTSGNYGSIQALTSPNNNTGTTFLINPLGGNVGVGGDTSPDALFSVGSTSQFQVNSSGAIAAATGVTSSGTITLSSLNTAGGLLYSNSSGVVANTAQGSSGQCLISGGSSTPIWTSCTAVGSFFNQSSGLTYLGNTTSDFVIGGTATSSAKFAVTNVNNGTPTASVSAGLAGGMYMTATGKLATTTKQNLTLGDSTTTGNVIISPSGNVGIGHSAPVAKLDIDADSGTSGLRIRGPSYTGDFGDIYVRGGGALVLSTENTVSAAAYVEIEPEDAEYGLLIKDGSTGTTAFANFYVTDTNTDYLNIVVNADKNTTGLVIDDSDKVGIGTTTPTGKFHVNGAATGKALAILNETGNQNIFAASASGTTRFVIQNDGSVGIGTASPNSKLQVSDTAGSAFDVSSTVTGGTGDATGGTINGSKVGGTADIVTGLSVSAGVFSSATAATTHGLYINGENSSSTVTDGYLLYLDGSFSATNNYGIYQVNSNAKNYFAGNVGIGDTTPAAALTVGNGDVFQVNSSGAIAAATGLTSSGTITLSALNTAGALLYTNSSGVVGNTAQGSSGQCLISNGSSAPSWTSCAGASNNYFNQSSGLTYLGNTTSDFAIGGTATSSAKFAVTNVNSGTPTASVSAGLAGGMYLTADGKLATTSKQSLTLGDSTTTGNVIINPSGNVGIGTASATQKFTLAGNFLQNPVDPSRAGGVSSTSLNGASGVSISGKYAYIASNLDDSFQILDISDPTGPSIVGGIKDATNLNGASGVAVSGRYAYVASAIADSIQIIDIANPANPFIVGGLTDATNLNGAIDIAISGRYAYVTNYNDNSLRIINISDPKNPSIVGGVKDNTKLSGATGVTIAGNYAYIASEVSDSLQIVNISDPTSPAIVGGVTDATNLNGATEVYVSGAYAYVTSYTNNSLEVINIANPLNPSRVGGIQDNTNLLTASGIFVSGKYAYVAARNANRLSVVDVSDPTSLAVVGGLTDATNLNGVVSVFVAGKYAYVSSYINDSFQAIEITGTDAPSASIGNIAAGVLSITDNAIVGNNLSVQNGLTIGSGGVLSNGSLVSTATTSANIFLSEVGIGTTAPTAKFEVSGAMKGKALTILNETGNQAIFSASASGTSRFTIENNGATTITGSALTTQTGFALSSMDSLTTGGGLTVNSNSSNTSTRNLASIVNDNAAAVGTKALSIQQDSNGNALFVDYNNSSGVSNNDRNVVHIDVDDTSVTSGTDFVTGLHLNMDRSGATSGTTGMYGMQLEIYGDTNTDTVTGLYVDVNGSATIEYAALFFGGLVGIGTDTPTNDLELWDTDSDGETHLFIGDSTPGSTAATAPCIKFGTTTTGEGICNLSSDLVFFESGSSMGTEAMRIAGGNLGIGDTSADAKLEVLGTSEQLRLTYTDGTVDSRISVDSSGHLTIDGSSDGTGSQTLTLTGYSTLTAASLTTMTIADNFYLGLGSGAGRIEFDDQSTDEVNILNARVGIGTTTPDEELQVNGDIHTNGAVYNTKKTFSYNPDAVSTFYTQYLGTFHVASGPVDITINDTGFGHGAGSFFRVTHHWGSGNAAIVQLQNVGLNGSNGAYTIYYRNVDDDSYELFFADVDSSSGNTITYTAYIQQQAAIESDTISASNDTDVTVATVAMATNYSGNVGIGATNPTAKLQVTSTTTTGNALSINANSLTTGYALHAYSDSSDTSSRRVLSVVNDNTAATGAIAMYVRQDSTADIVNIADGSTEVFTILDGGNVGIGNSAPGVKLHVGDTSVTDGTTLLRLQDANSTCNFTADSGSPTCGSDETLKKDVVSLDTNDLLTKVAGLRPVSYHWKTDGDDAPLNYGFIAQEVEAVFPELVTESTWGDGSTKKFLNIGGLVPYIVGAVKQQQLQIDYLSDNFTLTEQEKSVLGIASPAATKAGEEEESLSPASLITGEKELLAYSGLSKAEIANYKLWKMAGNIVFTGQISFADVTKFLSTVIFTSDTVGTITIPKNTTKVSVTFTKPFDKTPIVNLTPVKTIKGDYSLEEVTTEGFILRLTEGQETDVLFNWTAFISEGAKPKVKVLETPVPTQVGATPSPKQEEKVSPTIESTKVSSESAHTE